MPIQSERVQKALALSNQQFNLCLPDNFVIYAKRPDYNRINADHGIISPEELEDYYAGFDRYSILVESG